MSKKITHIPTILMPNEDIDMYKWSVIACDQFTSQRDYWDSASLEVGDSPSTLNLILPEVYLEDSDVSTRTEKIHETMRSYLLDGTLRELEEGIVLTERILGETIRRGIVISVDLEEYDYNLGSTSLIRPTEKTVVDRIPPRLNVRRGASIELPHIMLLIDDISKSIIEPLFEDLDKYDRIYDTELMLNGGHIRGYFVPKGTVTDDIEDKLSRLSDRDVFNEKYHCDNEPLLPFAVGDGNHSMATAKAYWEEIKKGLSESEMADHPARYALVEIVNIHDESLIIEPIHRVLFHTLEDDFTSFVLDFYEKNGEEATISDESITKGHTFPILSDGNVKYLNVTNPKLAIPVATIQNALDAYLEYSPNAKIDYIHGRDVVEKLSREGNIGLLLPDIRKEDIFRGVVFDGVLPRKTFSMGEAHEKRYYMESKSIL